MKKISMVLIAFASIVLASSCTEADTLDSALAAAKKQGKAVMLELGSVGCIPCEQMKPVMQKLRDTYNGKLEVIFIDVRVDNKSGRRFGVTMIPTQVFLDKQGKEFHRHIGYYAYDEIVPVLKKQGS
jgi:thioredoxin 1